MSAPEGKGNGESPPSVARESHEQGSGTEVRSEALLDLWSELQRLQRLTGEEPSTLTHVAFSALKLLKTGLTRYPIAREVLRKLSDALSKYGSVTSEVSGKLAEALNASEMYLNLADAWRSMGRDSDALLAYDKALELKADNATALANGAALLAKGNRYEEAIIRLRKAIQLKPGFAPYHTQLGDCLRRLGKYEEAVSELDRALSIQPADAWAVGTKGQVLRALGRDGAAIEALRRALALDPKLGWAKAELVRALAEAERNEEAVAATPAEVATAPENAELLTWSGVALRRVGRMTESVARLRAAVQAAPASTRALKELAESLRLSGENDEALQNLNRALELAPADAWASGTKGQVLAAMGRLAEAVDSFRSATKQDPGLHWAHIDLAAVFFRLGRHVEALDSLDRAARLLGPTAIVAQPRAAVLLALDRCQECLTTLDEALELPNADRGWIMGFKAHCLELTGEYAAAIPAIDEAIRENERVAWFHEVRGGTLLRLRSGDLSEKRRWAEEARRSFERALELDPKSASQWHTELGDAYRALGQSAEAQASYRRAIDCVAATSSEPDAIALANVGWCHFRLGNYDEAVRCDIEALSRETSDLLAMRFNLALALMCSGKHGLAEHEYAQVLIWVERRDRLLRRGFLLVALDDIEDAQQTIPGLAEVGELQAVMTRLRASYDEAKDASRSPTEMIEARK
jgi:tetratricopeptide (TPR) repeat protein